MNVTLIYSLLAYSSIKQRDFSGVYVSLTAYQPAFVATVSHSGFWNSLLSFSSVLLLQKHYCYFFTLCPQMVQQRPLSLHVWPPLCSFTAYFIAWLAIDTIHYILILSVTGCRMLPTVLVTVPFGVIAGKYQLVSDANTCTCW